MNQQNQDASQRAERDAAINEGRATIRDQVEGRETAREQRDDDDRFVTSSTPGGYANSVAATRDEIDGEDPKGIARGD